MWKLAPLPDHPQNPMGAHTAVAGKFRGKREAVVIGLVGQLPVSRMGKIGSKRGDLLGRDEFERDIF